MGRSQRTRGRRFEIYTPVLLPPGPFFDVYASIFELARQNVLADPSLIEGSDTLAWDYSLHAISVEPQDAAAELVRAVVAIPCGVVTSTASSPRCGCGAGAARRSRGRPAGGRNLSKAWRRPLGLRRHGRRMRLGPLPSPGLARVQVVLSKNRSFGRMSAVLGPLLPGSAYVVGTILSKMEVRHWPGVTH